jgi:hypothetical protein
MRAAFQFAVDRTTPTATTWWFGPAGGCLGAGLLWGAGVPVTFLEFITNPIAKSAFEVLVCVVVAYALLFLSCLILAPLHYKLLPYGGIRAYLKARGGKRMWPQYIMTLGFVVFFVGLVGFLQINVKPLPPLDPIPPAGNGFYVECRQQIGPIKMPPEGLYFIQVSESGGGGLSHLPITDPSQIGKDYSISNDVLVEALQCKISNYEALPTLNVTLSFKASFRKVERRGIVVLPGEIVGERVYHVSLSPLIGKIDPNGANAVTIYIQNRSRENGVTFIFSNTIAARLLTEEKVRSFQIKAGGTAPMLLPERPFPFPPSESK